MQLWVKFKNTSDCVLVDTPLSISTSIMVTARTSPACWSPNRETTEGGEDIKIKIMSFYTVKKCFIIGKPNDTGWWPFTKCKANKGSSSAPRASLRAVIVLRVPAPNIIYLYKRQMQYVHSCTCMCKTIITPFPDWVQPKRHVARVSWSIRVQWVLLHWDLNSIFCTA